MNKRALKRSLISSISRLIGIALGTSAGSLVHELVGGGVIGWGVALLMFIISFILVVLAEYEREVI